jgi:predicted metal-dependent phosphoesterase TrpH
MDTNALEAAIKTLTYPREAKNREERARLYAEYREQENALIAQWKTWLADEYADDLPAAAQNAIYRKAWEEGHSSGYYEVENHYSELSELGRLIRNA